MDDGSFGHEPSMTVAPDHVHVVDRLHICRCGLVGMTLGLGTLLCVSNIITTGISEKLFDPMASLSSPCILGTSRRSRILVDKFPRWGTKSVAQQSQYYP
jgi:hypothetical protein